MYKRSRFFCFENSFLIFFYLVPFFFSCSFSLSELQSVKVTGGGRVEVGEEEEKATYLEGNFLKKYVYVYFSYVPRMSRGVIGVFPSSSSSEEDQEEGTIILLNSASTTRASRAESEKSMGISMKRHATSMGLPQGR